MLQMERLQHEIRELKDWNATLNRKVRSLRDQRSQQQAKEEEMRAQQLALTQTVNHLFSEISALRTANRFKSQIDQDASCMDSDQ